MAVDIETSGLDPHQDRLLSIAVSDGTDVWILLDFFGFDYIREHLVDEDVLKIAHNAKFEHVWFKHHLGIDVLNWHDTFLTEKVIATDDSLPMSLDALVGRYGFGMMYKDVRATFEDHPGFAQLPVTAEQVDYMAQDVLFLGGIREQQVQYVDSMGLQQTVELEHSIIPAVSDLELNGVSIDIDLWFEQVVELERLAAQCDSKMREIIGDFTLHVPAMKDKKPIVKEIPTSEINFNSPKQLIQLFIDKFNIQTDTSNAPFLEGISQGAIIAEFLSLKLDIPVEKRAAYFAELLLAYKKYKKRIGFNYAKFVHPKTGKIHPTYHQLGARTGRFSCSKPNLQQVPRPVKGEPNMRHIWTADSEDFVIIRADYSQQEPRVMAQLCGDPAMIAACNSDDVYIAFGTHIFGYTIAKGSEERHTSKTFVLATGYGAGINKLAAVSGKDARTCNEIRQKIRRAFPIMATYGDKMHRMLTQYGYVETAIGRRRYIDNKLYTIAVNTPVQGTAADMFKLALAKIHQRLTNLKECGKIHSNTRVWNLVHDEIGVHCHKDEVDFVLPLVQQLMEEAGTELCPDVKHIAEAEYAYRWDK
jgi:DNA polymerase-1